MWVRISSSSEHMQFNNCVISVHRDEYDISIKLGYTTAPLGFDGGLSVRDREDFFGQNPGPGFPP